MDAVNSAERKLPLGLITRGANRGKWKNADGTVVANRAIGQVGISHPTKACEAFKKQCINRMRRNAANGAN